jgi:endoglucanase
VSTCASTHFGYRSSAAKTVILRQATVGWDAPSTFLPGPLIEVLDETGRTVFQAPAKPWHNGDVHEQSGDRVWWFDFSAVTQPGRYRIAERRSGEITEEFVVFAEPYRDVLRQALRMFYHQRCGIKKQQPFTEAP